MCRQSQGRLQYQLTGRAQDGQDAAATRTCQGGVPRMCRQSQGRLLFLHGRVCAGGPGCGGRARVPGRSVAHVQTEPGQAPI